MKPPPIKLTLPTHVPMRYVYPALGILFVLQILEGTHVVTSAEFCAFVVVSADAFNTCGGMIYPSGAYVFFCALLTLILGGLAKTALGEPLDTNVFDAQRSMLVYLAGMTSMWVAARISARIRRTPPFLAKFQLSGNVEQAAIGCALLGYFGGMLIPLAYISTFNQINFFIPLALFLTAYGATRKSDGYRSFSTLGFVLWAWNTVTTGLFAFSKSGMFAPSVAWALGALIAGYRITLKKAVLIGTFAIAGSAILTPISQVGRVYREDPDSQAKAIDMLMHPLETRERYNKQIAGLTERRGYNWFNSGQGLMDRLTMFPIDDALIDVTDHGHVATLFPITTYVTNMIPRYFVSEKATWHWGNRYAHEIGMLGPNDTTTGISFSPFSDGYHCAMWWGVTVISMPIFLMMFWVCDSLTGSTKDALWAMMYILMFSHTASEGMLNAPFGSVSVGVFAVAMCAIVGSRIAPVLGGLFMPANNRARPVTDRRWVPPPSASMVSGPRTIEGKL